MYEMKKTNEGREIIVIKSERWKVVINKRERMIKKKGFEDTVRGKKCE